MFGLDLMTTVYVIIGIILFIGVSIATSQNEYWWSEVKKVEKKDTVNSAGITASKMARDVIREYGLNLKIAMTQGKYKDYYSPRDKTIVISDGFYNSYSIIALAVVAHELGHAIDHQKGGFVFNLRKSIARLAMLLNRIFWLVVIASIVCYFIGEPEIALTLLWTSGGIFAFGILFRLFTLHTEIVATNYAITILKRYGLNEKEIKIARKLLSAALITYIGDVFMPFVNILKIITWILYNTLGRLFRV